MKKPIYLALALLFIVTLIPAAFAPQPPLLADTYINATIGEPQYADPGAAYDSASGDMLRQIYDNLVQCKKESTSEFEPMLATGWTISPDELTWTFKIRSGVKFHNGAILTPEDIEYTFERDMVMDFSGGPIWMFLEPLVGVFTTREYDLTNETQVVELGQKIDASVESTADSVLFHMPRPYPATVFLQILANMWGSILNKAWAVEHGSWPGEWGDYKGWVAYNDPAVPPLDDPEPVFMGTGAFKFDYWDKTVEYSIVKFDDYWAGWPAPTSRGFITRYIEKVVTEWATRKLMFLAGDVDWVAVPRANILELQEGGSPTGAYLPGINCFKGMPTGVCDAVFFTQNINPASVYDGSGALDGDGIPVDFFNDVHVRKGFAWSFDFATFIRDAYLGEATQPRTVMPEELGYVEWVNPDVPRYSFNLANAEAEFKLAFGGQVWEKGFRMTLVYNSGNVARKTACDILAANLATLNPKFRVDSLGVDWPTFLAARRARQLPINVLGWHHDYVDPHNWFMPFMHTYGDFSFFSGYSNPEADALITAGIQTTDRAERLDIYYQLEQIYFDDTPNFAITSTFARRYDRTWVAGWYSNNLVACRYWNIWKQIVPPDTGYPMEDVVQDGRINIIDISTQAKGFGSTPGHPRWMVVIRADVDRNGVVNIVDLAKVAKKFGTTIPAP